MIAIFKEGELWREIQCLQEKPLSNNVKFRNINESVSLRCDMNDASIWTMILHYYSYSFYFGMSFIHGCLEEHCINDEISLSK